MRNVLLLLFVAWNALQISAQTSQNMELLGHWYEDTLIANSTNVRFTDCYGFVWQGREYAVAGSTEGTHVFEISDDNQFIPKGFVKGRFSNAGAYHRDYSVFGHYLYAVCDEGVSDLQIIDFQYLPDSIHVAREDSLLFGRVHNIFIDTLQQKLYSCIHRSTANTQTIEAPLKIFSLADPLQPVELWSGPDDIPEVHDIYVRNGKAILNCGFDGLRVYDFTNTAAPAYLDSKSFYSDQGYNHQGWLTPSGNTYIFADETNGMRVKKCSFSGSLVTINQYFGTNVSGGSVPHNIMATDTFAFVAYYNEGFRVFDIRHNPPVEIAHYDTYPIDNDPFKLNGNWGVYALLPSQRILASDRQFGLFLLGFDREAFAIAPPEESTVAYPNPLMPGEELLVRLPNDVTAFEWEVFDAAGKKVLSGGKTNGNYLEIVPEVAAGLYQLRLRHLDYLGDEVSEIVRLIVL